MSYNHYSTNLKRKGSTVKTDLACRSTLVHSDNIIGYKYKFNLITLYSISEDSEVAVIAACVNHTSACKINGEN